MYWLSNSVVLRIIISQVFGSPDNSNLHKRNGSGHSTAKWKDISSRESKRVPIFNTVLVDWQDPSTFTAAIENIELWIFSRIVESVWWQVRTLKDFYLFPEDLLYYQFIPLEVSFIAQAENFCCFPDIDSVYAIFCGGWTCSTEEDFWKAVIFWK